MVDGGGGFYNFVVVFLLGILGLDKIALRAPLTAAFKFFVNIATFGSWAVYDWIQTWGDQDFVKKYGYSTPFGPDGHGYNMVGNTSSLEASPSKPSGFALLLYYIYVISCLILPIGLGNIIAGDTWGGLGKLISCMAFITIPVYMIMGCIEFATSGTIEQKGVPRTFPMYPFFFLKDKHPASSVIPKGPLDEKTKTYKPNHQVSAYETDVALMVSQGKQPIVQGLVSSISSTVGQALTNWPPVAAFQTVSAAKDGIQAVGDITKAVATEVKKDPKALLSAVGVKLPPTPTLKVPEAPQDVTKLATALQQTGGSLAVYPEMDNLLMGGMAVLVIGGLVAAAFRKISFSKKTDDHEYPLKTYGRDDSPPVPGGV